MDKRIVTLCGLVLLLSFAALAGPGADSEIMHEIAEEAYEDEPAIWHGLTIHFWIGVAPFILIGIIALLVNIIHKVKKGLGFDD